MSWIHETTAPLQMDAQPAPDSTYWTIAYRKPKANRFQRATDVATTWQEATQIARRVGIAHPDLEVWTTTTAEAERNGFGADEDNGNILTNSGKRVRVIDNGSLASLLPSGTAARQAIAERVAIDIAANARSLTYMYEGIEYPTYPYACGDGCDICEEFAPESDDAERTDPK